jgi:hypothetical protein
VQWSRLYLFSRSDEEEAAPQSTDPEPDHSNLGAGDSYLVLDVLPDELADVAFQKLEEEVSWDIMHHRGKAAQGPAQLDAPQLLQVEKFRDWLQYREKYPRMEGKHCC